MKIDYEILLKVWHGARFINFDQNIDFEHINMASPPNEPVPNGLRHLFFALSDLRPEVNGWYDTRFDRKSFFPKITFDQPHWTFVINKHTDLDSLNPSAKVIVVDSVTAACKQLLSYALNLVKPKVCAVTGSVGKTTCVALIEQILSIKYQCLRLYAKRISPPILCMMIINKIELDTQFVVLEMAMWRKDHIQVLARLLPPTVSVILNIKPVHIGVETINSIEDILESKSEITKGAIPVINFDDPLLLRNYKSQNDTVSFGIDNKTADVYIEKIDILKNEVHLNLKGVRIEFEPFLLTRLTLYQVLAACCVGIIGEVPLSDIADELTKLEPKENRLVWIRYNSHQILFDGERTLDERMNELGDNYYDDTTLIIYRFEDKYPLSFELFPSIFSKFSRVYILDDFNNKEQLSTLNLPTNTKFINHSQLLDNVPKNSMIFFHYSIYYRFEELKSKDPAFLLEHLNS